MWKTLEQPAQATKQQENYVEGEMFFDGVFEFEIECLDEEHSSPLHLSSQQ